MVRLVVALFVVGIVAMAGCTTEPDDGGAGAPEVGTGSSGSQETPGGSDNTTSSSPDEPASDANVTAPAEDLREVMHLFDASMAEGLWLVEESDLVPTWPEGFSAAPIFMGGAYPAGTIGLHLQPIKFGSASIGEQQLEGGHLVYWGTYVEPPEHHRGESALSFVWTSVIVDDPALADWFEAANASVQIGDITSTVGTPEMTHVHLAVDVDAGSYAVDLAGQRLSCSDCHQSWESTHSIRFFGIEDGQVRSYIDANRTHGNMVWNGASVGDFSAAPGGIYPDTPVGMASHSAAPADFTFVVSRPS